MLANNSVKKTDPTDEGNGVVDAAVITADVPTPPSGDAPAGQPKRSIGVKEVIPFAWKLLGDACDGMTMTLFKAVEREEVEAHFERTTRDGHYNNLRIVKADEKIVQPKVKNPLHFINSPKPPPPEKKTVKAKKTKVAAPSVVKVKRKKVKATSKTAKKTASKKKTKKSVTSKKVKKKAATKKKKAVKKATKQVAKKVTKKKAPTKKKATAKKKTPAKKKAVTKKKKKKK